MARHTITFDDNGMKTEVVEYEIEVLDEKGVQAIAQQTLDYNSYFANQPSCPGHPTARQAHRSCDLRVFTLLVRAAAPATRGHARAAFIEHALG